MTPFLTPSNNKIREQQTLSYSIVSFNFRYLQISSVNTNVNGGEGGIHRAI